jgi:hypothetical protein
VSDGAIIYLLGYRVSEALLRKEISRLKLYRPRKPCYGVEIVSDDLFRWTKRSRGAVTKTI